MEAISSAEEIDLSQDLNDWNNKVLRSSYLSNIFLPFLME
jgi:hypothetical protein